MCQGLIPGKTADWWSWGSANTAWKPRVKPGRVKICHFYWVESTEKISPTTCRSKKRQKLSPGENFQLYSNHNRTQSNCIIMSITTMWPWRSVLVSITSVLTVSPQGKSNVGLQNLRHMQGLVFHVSVHVHYCTSRYIHTVNKALLYTR